MAAIAEIKNNRIPNHDEHTVTGPDADGSSTIAPAAVTADPFDPATLVLNQDFEATSGTKILTTVPVRRPDRQWWYRVHPEESWRLQTAVLEIKEDRETYLISRELWPTLGSEIVGKMIFTAINRQGVLFLWPVRLPQADNRRNQWPASEMENAQLGMRSWTRSAANMSLGAYEASIAPAGVPDPQWPTLSFNEVLKIAFRDRFIATINHPVLRRLRGEL